jgi:hypothetical protein
MQVRGSWAADPDPRVRVLFSAGRDACGVPYAHRLMCESTGKPLACDVNETAAASASAATERAHHADHIKGEQEKLLAEQAQYNDVLLLPVVDVYRHLARKKKLAFKWVHDHTQARFAMKVHGIHADDSFSFNYYYCTMLTCLYYTCFTVKVDDEDNLVSVRNLLAATDGYAAEQDAAAAAAGPESGSGSGAKPKPKPTGWKPTVWGHLDWSTPVTRTGKNRERAELTDTVYPTYPVGCRVLISTANLSP